MQNRFGLLNTNVMPIFHNHCLDILITMRFSINCSAVICSPSVIHAIMRGATRETYGPRVYFISYKFPIYNYSLLFFLFCDLYFSIYTTKIPKKLSYYLYQISHLQVVVKGLTTPFIVLVARFLIVCAGTKRFACSLLQD